METGQLESPNFPEDYQVFFTDDDDDDGDDGVDDGDEPAWVAKLSREL